MSLNVRVMCETPMGVPESSKYTCNVTSSNTSSQTQTHLRNYTREEVSIRCHSEACWVIIREKVYDVTTFMQQHPGGEDILLEHAGRDATLAFSDVGHSSDAQEILKKYCIGHLAEVDRPVKRSPQSLLPTGC